MTDDPIDIALSLHRTSVGRVGEDRFRLLEAVREHGSIAAAARAVGVSYKTAWDGIDALNNLFDRPLVETRAGGRRGGGAALTRDGDDVLAAYRFVRERLARVLSALETGLDRPESMPLLHVLRSLRMKTSARNALSGVVETVTPGAVNAEVVVRLTDGLGLVAIVTNRSVADLALAPGRDVVALIKSSFVVLAPEGETGRTSARNRLCGTIVRHHEGAVNDEVVLDLGGGKTVTAIVTKGSAEALGLAIGERVCALVKASHIILAVD